MRRSEGCSSSLTRFGSVFLSAATFLERGGHLISVSISAKTSPTPIPLPFPNSTREFTIRRVLSLDFLDAIALCSIRFSLEPDESAPDCPIQTSIRQCAVEHVLVAVRRRVSWCGFAGRTIGGDGLPAHRNLTDVGRF